MSETSALKGQITVDQLLPELTDVFGARNGLGGAMNISARSDSLAGWGWWNSWGHLELTHKTRRAVHGGAHAVGSIVRTEGYDGALGAASDTPPRISRRFELPFSPALGRAQNAIEHMFGRLQDFRRTAARYEKLAINFLTAVHLASIVCYWF
jgi:transposase